MEETFDQKIFRNVQGKFSVYKTTEVTGDKALTPNVEWEDPEKVDEFFQFAQFLGAKVIYITEGEEINEDTNESRNSIMQVGFLHQGVMHHINVADDSDEDDDDSDEYEDDDYEDDESYEDEESDNEYETDDEYAETSEEEASDNEPVVQNPSQATQAQYNQNMY